MNGPTAPSVRKGSVPVPDSKGQLTRSTAFLGEKLYSLRKSGKGLDAALLAGPELNQVKIPVHKLVLSAVSSVFENKLADRWEGEGTVQLPSEIGLEAAEAFVKFIYVGGIDRSVGTEVLLQLLILGDLYLVPELVDESTNLLLTKMDRENCAQIFESVYLIESSAVGKAAWDMFTGCTRHLVNNEDVARWSASTWEKLLSGSIPYIDEVQLFQGLMKWRKADPLGRAEEFPRLLKLIRFPLMGSMAFTTHVLPTGVLTQEEVMILYQFYGGKSDPPPPFNCTTRNRFSSPDAQTLTHLLRYAGPGDVVTLGEGEFPGNFVLQQFFQNNVSLVGGGKEKTKLVGTLTLLSGRTWVTLRGFTVEATGQENSESSSAISLQCDGSSVEDLLIVNGDLTLTGNENRLRNLKLINGRLKLKGNENKLNKIEFSNLPAGVESCFLLEGNSNELEEICFKDEFFRGEGRAGVCIKSGDKNKVKGVDCEVLRVVPPEASETAQEMAPIPAVFDAVVVEKGEGNEIKGAKEKEEGPPLRLVIGGSENLVAECSLREILLKADAKEGFGHSLKECQVVGTVWLEGGAKYHRMRKVKGRRIEYCGGYTGQVHFVQCEFSESGDGQRN